MFRIPTILLAMLAIALTGCTGFTGQPAQQQLIATPGQYSPGPGSNPRLTIAVPEMAVPAPVGLSDVNELPSVAATELVRLTDASGRFTVIDPEHLHQLLTSQGAADMLEPGKISHPAALHGVDYLLLGQIKELSVRKDPEPAKFSVAGVEKMLNLGQGHKPKLIADGKVDLWLVNPATGAIEVSGHGDYHRVAPPEDFGFQLKSRELAGQEQVTLDTADSRTAIRLMLDDALRQMLPRYDRWAGEPTLHPQVAAATTQPAQATGATSAPAAIVEFCPNCGVRVSPADEFCPNCGHKLH